jgi:hypothetical protein
MISCPSCSTRQDASGKAEPPNSDLIATGAGTSKTQPVEGLTSQQISILMMVLGIGVCLLGIWFVISEWNLWWDCEVSYYQPSDYEEMGCGQNTFLTTMFTSCCLLLPIGFFLASFGYNYGQNQGVTPQVHNGAVPYAAPTGQFQGHTPNQQPVPLPVNQQGAFGKAVQSTAVGLGVGVASVATIALAAVALFIILLMIIAVTW